MAGIDRTYEVERNRDSSVQLHEAGPLVEIRVELPPPPGTPYRSGGRHVLGYGLIDTGAKHCALDHSVVDELGLTSPGDGHTIGIGGKVATK